jgi:hypothetical protein
MEQEELSLWTRVRRLLVRIFLARNNCNGQCTDCANCPWLDKEKYTFEIKRKVES